MASRQKCGDDMQPTKHERNEVQDFNETIFAKMLYTTCQLISAQAIAKPYDNFAT